MTKKQLNGLVGFVCEVTDLPVSFSNCLDCAIKGAPGCSMVPAVVQAAVNSIRDPAYADNLAFEAGADVGFSVTELLSCPRQTRLKAENPYYEKPTALYRMNRGTGYHAMLSAATANGYISETTLTWKFTYRGKSILLVGTPDLVEWTPKGWFITDYKVTSRAPFGVKQPFCNYCGSQVRKHGDRNYFCDLCQIQLKPAQTTRVYQPAQPRSSHVMQVNLYALLIEKNIKILQKRIPSADAQFAGAEIVYFPDKAPVRCASVLDRNVAMAFLKARLAALIAPELPPVINDSDDLWRCDYCPVRRQCEQIHGSPVGKEALELEVEQVLAEG